MFLTGAPTLKTVTIKGMVEDLQVASLQMSMWPFARGHPSKV
jgi:hypothetical protein